MICEKKEKSGDGFYKTLILLILLGLGLYFTFSIGGSKSLYKDEIKSLQSIIDSLNIKLSNSIQKDSILFYLAEQENYNKIIESLNTDIKNLKERYEKRDIMDVDTLSIDENIRILTRFLSQENNN